MAPAGPPPAGEPRAIGEAIYAVFADCSDAGSDGDLEETDPVVLQALDGWLSLDDALEGLPTGTRDELTLEWKLDCRSRLQRPAKV